jgi:hypothetical protein
LFFYFDENKPTRGNPTLDDSDEGYKAEVADLKFAFEEEAKTWLAKKKRLEEKKTYAHALIYTHSFASSMGTKLEQEADYSTEKLRTIGWK